ncbi:unnamed protein product [Phytomonas sp. Hart1]|nr:unnamed protein product [Phytomonas sp. Hart1]|eukprot:CCW71757.1 unnamed protein product [Phytomonas sp. isolate Hart1]
MGPNALMGFLGDPHETGPNPTATPCSSVSSLRIASVSRLGALSKPIIGRPPSTMPSHGFATYGFEIAKTLKEIVHGRDEGVFLRVLPKSQLIGQLILQESGARDLMGLQEANLRMLLTHKRVEERAKKEEQQLSRRSKERQEELKKRYAEELNEQKNSVMLYNAGLEKGLRERLKALAQLQPRLNLVNVVLAAMKDESNDLSLTAELLEEAKKLQKALKTDSRFNKTATPELDGGALPYWLKHCIVSSFNVAAIVKGSPYRAVVLDAPNLRSKLLADRKIIAIREVALSEKILSWAHTRIALPDAGAAVKAFLEFAEGDAGAPAGLCQGVVWTKEVHPSIARVAKAAGSSIPSQSVLSLGDVSSIELTTKEVKSIGEAASV